MENKIEYKGYIIEKSDYIDAYDFHNPNDCEIPISTYKTIEDCKSEIDAILDEREMHDTELNPQATTNSVEGKREVVDAFLKELSEKHDCPLNKLMIGYTQGELHVWEYDQGAANVFKQLEIL